MRRRFFSSLLFFALISAGLLSVNFVFAQNLDVGVNEISNTIALSATDPRIIVARIINIALLFLGVIAVGLIIYAGFLWMTSGGSEDKIDQAKNILKNAIIGLVIILSAWGIVSFIMSRLLGATGNGGLFNGNSGSSSLVGTGAMGACTVERVYPEDGQTGVARNTSLIITFKEPLLLTSVCQNESGEACACDQTSCNLINPAHIRIFRQDFGDNCGDASCPADNTNVSRAHVSASSDRQTLIITPNDFLGSPDGDTDYQVKFTSGILKDNGDSIFKTCNTDWFQWGFRVSNNLDLTPPQVLRGGVFPLPDNERDLYGQTVAAVPAQAAVTVNSCPQIYQAPSVLGVTPTAGNQNGNATLAVDFHQNISALTVVTTSENNQAQLFAGQELLGVANWNGNQIIFPGFFQLDVDGHEAGNAWQVNIQPEILADQLTVGGEIYTFSEANSGNNIPVMGCNNLSIVALNIYVKLSGHPDINVDLEGNKVALTAKVAGAAGNNLNLSTTNSDALSLQAFNGGVDMVKTSEVKDRHDRPMNSVIQLNFNEAVNPMLVSGSADETADYIRIVNAESSATEGEACNTNADCASYKCSDNVCAGNYLSGKFLISNAYKTVEFISDVECGQNGCGEKIYCLPANSHLAVQLVAANLKTCSTDTDCANFQPFSQCAPFSNYLTCQDANGKNYPVANLNQLDGIVDAAANSLDGNRDVFADGPIAFYNENEAANLELKDKYRWSFYINDQIMSDPPQISFIKPDNNSLNADTKAPVQINFNTLMMNASLRTGNIWVNNGQKDVEHHLINLFTSSPAPVGYWITAENRDVSPLDGEPDLTFAFLNHTEMGSSVTYKSQVGSGVKDIYQNCFKPSAGPNCAANPGNPSCCYGVPTDILGDDGNCQ
ncbi:MAG: Ig-like domain-containing protein [Patescibacteria group bacterium]|nr:Ig-like domain-containing protein [Patescibacteria group bacterium]